MKTNNHSEIGWHMILGAIVFLMLVPIVFALSNSFKTLQDAFNTIFEIIPSHPTLENYRHVFEKLPFVQITLNTFLIAASVTAFKTITSLFAAYSFVYFEYKGKQFFYFIMLSTMFIPFTVTMIPKLPDDFKNRSAGLHLGRGTSAVCGCFRYLPAAPGHARNPEGPH